MFSKKLSHFFNTEQTQRIYDCIRTQENKTSGEIRLCIETRCKYVDPLDRVRELFYQLKMYKTENRNAVLIYIAYKDRDFALFGDGGIYSKVEPSFWKQESNTLATYFSSGNYEQGIIHTITQVGNTLAIHFPASSQHKNELPDEIVFGK